MHDNLISKINQNYVKKCYHTRNSKPSGYIIYHGESNINKTKYLHSWSKNALNFIAFQ